MRCKEREILAHGGEGRRRLEQHEAEFEPNAELLQRIDRRDILFDGDALVERAQTGLVARFQAHVDKIEAGIAHAGEEIGVDRIGPAADLPQDPIREPRAMEFIAEVSRPLAPFRAIDREVVVLEEEERDVVLVVEHPHLFDDVLGRAQAHDLAGGRPVEHVDRAERAGADTAAARQHVGRVAAEEGAPLIFAVGIGKAVEIVNEGAQRAAGDCVRARVGKTRNAVKIAAGAEHVGEFEQRLLALEAHDAVELGNVLDRFGVAERRKMAADGEMAVDPAVP